MTSPPDDKKHKKGIHVCFEEEEKEEKKVDCLAKPLYASIGVQSSRELLKCKC